MQRTFSPARKGPMITAIMNGETPEELIAQIRGAEYDGADGIGERNARVRVGTGIEYDAVHLSETRLMKVVDEHPFDV